MDPLNLILLIIVALVFFRLRSVLGTRNDDEKSGDRKDAYRLNRDAFAHKNAPPLSEASDEGSRDEPGQADAEAREPVAQSVPSNQLTQSMAADAVQAQEGRGLAFLREVEPQFDEAGFLDGASRAYEMILTAFADGDLSPVEGFLGAEVTDGFAAAIVARGENNQQLVTQILRLDRPSLEDATVNDTTIELDVRFRAEIISASFEAGRDIGEDDLPAPTTSIDVWRFEGQRGSAPNWTLIATQAE